MYIFGHHNIFGQHRSLEVGKLADLMILSDNPLKIEKTKIREIQVLETFKEGESVYRKD